MKHLVSLQTHCSSSLPEIAPLARTFLRKKKKAKCILFSSFVDERSETFFLQIFFQQMLPEIVLSKGGHARTRQIMLRGYPAFTNDRLKGIMAKVTVKADSQRGQEVTPVSITCGKSTNPPRARSQGEATEVRE